ncbi:MAG: methyltransferase domain-containing protein [Candidatus Pacebacteria bacterium]|nr:methyltransferase domain-containing protein [Candidatus Paceibacterota bacterium]
MQAKEFFLTKLEESHDFQKGEISILDLGSGQSKNFLPFLGRHPHTRYVGVEPSEADARVARMLLAPFPNARVHTQLAYEPLIDETPFDVVLSLSVLEHVKRLEHFLANSVAMAKTGGRIIHRYDLGHALHPSSWKERLQVFLGNHVPFVLPEHKFVRYVDPEEVRTMLQRHGARVTAITQHQMPNHKEFLKYFPTNTGDMEQLSISLLEWESAVAPHLAGIPKKIRERLFPSICVWAVKE